MSSRRALVLAFVAVLAGYTAIATIMLDMRARKRIEHTAGVNSFGYQGDAMFHKRSGERRIALVGGSAAFGVRTDNTNHELASKFQQALNQGWRPQYRGELTTVVGLAEPGAGAASYLQTLEDYAYLNPEAICIYDGYAPVNGGAIPSRRDSATFRHIGYLPALAGPGAMPRTSSVAVDPSLRDDATGDVSCHGSSAAYCAAMGDTVNWALAHGKNVAVITPPYISTRHRQQQESLAALLQQRFSGDKRFVYDNEGPAIDLRQSRWSTDGIHLTAAGIERLADNLVEPLLTISRRP
jgi:hypothetical protein